MALVRKSSDQKAMRKKVAAAAAAAMVAEATPFMLKDHLMDDMSSCSSNGFKSYPRRQCCATVRFLDRPKKKRSKAPPLKRSCSRAAASITMSALQRASAAVVNAVKLIPFRSVKSGARASTVATRGSARKVVFLPRSFSRKLLRRSFWKKKMEETGRRSRLFGELLGDGPDKPSDETTTSSISPSTAITASRSSDGFAEIDLSRSTSQNDVAEGETDLLPDQKVSVTDGHDSTEAATTTCSEQNAEVWQTHEEKEQFSPVSVLDCPFEDEDEEEEELESSSQFQRNLARAEGTKQKVMPKTRRLESVAQVEPLDLEKLISLSEQEEGPRASLSPMQDHDHRTSISTNVKVNADNEGHEIEQELEELLKQVKATMSHTPKFIADNLLLDFFRESLAGDDASLSEKESLTAASDWVNGRPREVLIGWEVKEGREMYVKDMEKGRRWRGTTSLHEKEEVALELEGEVWTSLVNELVIDLF